MFVCQFVYVHFYLILIDFVVFSKLDAHFLSNMHNNFSFIFGFSCFKFCFCSFWIFRQMVSSCLSSINYEYFVKYHFFVVYFSFIKSIILLFFFLFSLLKQHFSTLLAAIFNTFSYIPFSEYKKITFFKIPPLKPFIN